MSAAVLVCFGLGHFHWKFSPKSSLVRCAFRLRRFAQDVWHFLDVAKTLAGVGQNERWFWRSFCGRYSIFGELGRRFERVTSHKSCFVKLSSFFILDMVMIPCGNCSISWQAQYFVDLGTKVAET